MLMRYIAHQFSLISPIHQRVATALAVNAVIALLGISCKLSILDVWSFGILRITWPSFNYLFGAATIAIIIIYCPIPANYHHNFYHPHRRISFIAVAIAAAASAAAIIIINDEVVAAAVAHSSATPSIPSSIQVRDDPNNSSPCLGVPPVLGPRLFLSNTY